MYFSNIICVYIFIVLGVLINCSICNSGENVYLLIFFLITLLSLIRLLKTLVEANKAKFNLFVIFELCFNGVRILKRNEILHFI